MLTDLDNEILKEFCWYFLSYHKNAYRALCRHKKKGFIEAEIRKECLRALHVVIYQFKQDSEGQGLRSRLLDEGKLYKGNANMPPEQIPFTTELMIIRRKTPTL